MPAEQNNVERTLGILLAKIEGIEKRLERADVSRAGIHQRLDQLVIRTTHLEADVFSTKSKVEAIEDVTDAVVQLRERALGAGTLGRWLLWIGGGVITAGGWAAAIYTWITGRPPP